MKTNFDKWLYLLNNITTFEKMPSILKEHIFRKVLKLAEYTALPKADQELYDEDLKRFRDYINTLDTREEKGRREGKKEQAIETAKSMLLVGLSIDKVVQYSGLSLEEVKSIKL